MQFNIGHADGRHLTGSVGQAPPGAVRVVVGGLAVHNGHKARSGFILTDDARGRQRVGQLFAVGCVKGHFGGRTVRAGDGEGEMDGFGRIGGFGGGSGFRGDDFGGSCLRRSSGGSGSAAARQQSSGQRQAQDKGRKLFHDVLTSLML